MSTTLDRNQRAHRKVVQKEIRETEKFHKRISTSYSSDLKQAGVPEKEIEVCEKLLLRYGIDISSQMIGFFQKKKNKNTTIEDAEYNPLANTEVTPIDSSACERVAQKQKEQKENQLKLTEKQAFDDLTKALQNAPFIAYETNTAVYISAAEPLTETRKAVIRESNKNKVVFELPKMEIIQEPNKVIIKTQKPLSEQQKADMANHYQRPIIEEITNAR